MPDPSEKRQRRKFIRKVNCQVCGDVANDHNHYGAKVCYSCRAFFRRGSNIKKKSYACTTGDQKCEIYLKTRKQCLFCRYKKCLEVGMRADWVMNEKDRQEMMMKRQGKEKSATNYEERMNHERFLKKSQRRGKTTRSTLTNEELQQISSLLAIEVACNGKNQLTYDTARLLEDAFSFGSSIGPSEIDELISIFIDRITNLVKSLEMFSGLTFKDQRCLLQENILPAVSLHVARLLQCPDPINFLFVNDAKTTTNEITSNLPCANNNGPRISYPQLFQSPWASSIEFEEKYENLLHKIHIHEMDDITYLLLTVVVMTRPGSLISMDKKDVNCTHGTYVTLLKRYLHTQIEQKVSNFCYGDCVEIFGILQEMSEILMDKRIKLTNESFRLEIIEKKLLNSMEIDTQKHWNVKKAIDYQEKQDLVINKPEDIDKQDSLLVVPMHIDVPRQDLIVSKLIEYREKQDLIINESEDIDKQDSFQTLDFHDHKEDTFLIEPSEFHNQKHDQKKDTFIDEPSEIHREDSVIFEQIEMGNQKNCKTIICNDIETLFLFQLLAD